MNSGSGCKPADLPKELTRAAWEPYLNATFHQCFDQLGTDVAKFGVVVRKQSNVATLDCSDLKLGCVVIVSDDILTAGLDPGAVAFVLGHEAAHIRLRHPDFAMMGGIEVEFAADSLAAESIAQGACYGARATDWVMSRYVKTIGAEDKTTEAMWYRRIALLGQCGLGATRSR
ncbi:MAG: M48 family metalloprotease [Patescibacteria group bacterium]